MNDPDPNWINNPSHFGHIFWLGKGITWAGFWIGLGIMMFGLSYCTAHKPEPIKSGVLSVSETKGE